MQRALLEEFEYEALETCAADGSCQLACPVGIDTGKLVKELRDGAAHASGPKRAALATAKRWGAVEGASRAGPAPRRPAGAADQARRGAARRRPRASCRRRSTPGRRRRLRPLLHQPHLRPGCATASAWSRRWSRSRRRAGLPVWIPDDVAGSCCGLPWSSKGFGEAHRHKANEMVERLWGWSGEGALPIVIDAASCTRRDRRARRGRPRARRTPSASAKLEILDSVAWAHDRLLPWLEVAERSARATVHPTCATRHLGLARRLDALADALADDVYVAPSATCCGFAGDRGISHPELTAAATRPEADELAGRHFDAHLSSNRTCEIGLERATGEPYESFVFLLERLEPLRLLS